MVFPASTSAIYSSRSWECGTPGFPSSSITTSSEDHTESWRVPNLRLPIELPITCFLTVESAKLLATYSASATTSSKGFFWQLKRPNSFSSYPSSCAKWSSETPSDWVPNSWLPFQLPRFRGSFLSLLSHVSDSTMPAYHSSFTSGCQLVANMSLLPIKTQVFLIMI